MDTKSKKSVMSSYIKWEGSMYSRERTTAKRIRHNDIWWKQSRIEKNELLAGTNIMSFRKNKITLQIYNLYLYKQQKTKQRKTNVIREKNGTT